MAFSLDGRELYCACDAAMEVFDVARPGHTGQRIRTSPNRASKQGQKGLLSSLAFAPDHSGLLAAGSFVGTVGLYDTAAEGCPLVELLRSEGQINGVTKVQFHSTGHLLYVASRLSGAVEVWDLRNLGKKAGRLERKGRTNQRLGFDVDASGEWLVAGDQDGVLSCFAAKYDGDNAAPLAHFRVAEGKLQYEQQTPSAHKLITARVFADAVGTACFVPYQHGQILVCCGSRHLQDSLDLNSSDDEVGGVEGSHGRAVRRPPGPATPSLQLLQFV